MEAQPQVIHGGLKHKSGGNAVFYNIIHHFIHLNKKNKLVYCTQKNETVYH